MKTRSTRISKSFGFSAINRVLKLIIQQNASWNNGFKQARAQGTRMLEDLRNGVEGAIKALGSGFIDHSSNIPLRESLRSGP